MSKFEVEKLTEWAELATRRARRIPDVAQVRASDSHVMVSVWTEEACRAAWRLVRDLGIPQDAVCIEVPREYLVPYPNDDQRSIEEIALSVDATRRSLRPVADAESRLLVLGSMPGNQSLRKFQYYAHPRNRFWGLIEDTLGVSRHSSYEARVTALAEAGIALWDVLKSCHRVGSLDHNIDSDTEEPNDLVEFLREHPSVSVIALNGRKAATAYRRHHAEKIAGARGDGVMVYDLPSSPANTRYSYEALRKEWGSILHGTW